MVFLLVARERKVFFFEKRGTKNFG